MARQNADGWSKGLGVEETMNGEGEREREGEGEREGERERERLRTAQDGKNQRPCKRLEEERMGKSGEDTSYVVW